VPGNDTEYADMLDILNEKINLFEVTESCNANTSSLTQTTIFSLPNTSTDFYRLGTVKFSSLTNTGTNLCTDPLFTSTGSNLIASSDAMGTSNQAANLAVSGLLPNTNVLSTYSSISKDKTYQLEFTLANTTGLTGEGIFYLVGETSSSAIGPVNNPIYYAQTAAFGLGGNRGYSFVMRPDAVFPQGLGASGIFTAGNSGKLALKAFSSGGFTGTITSVSLKEVGTSWTITPSESWEVGDKANATQGQATTASQTWEHNDNDTTNRGNKAWAKDPYGNQRVAGFLENSMSLTEGKRFSITYTITGATAGKLLLSDCLASDIITNEINGTFKNMLIYDKNSNDSEYNQNGTFTKYWTQGANNTSKISIYHNSDFDGAISNVIVQDQAATLDTVEVERIMESDIQNLLSSNLAAPTTTRPVYTRKGNDLYVYPTTITHGVTCNYVKKPVTPYWGYTEINGAALYNAGTSVNFEIHESEGQNLVIRILKMAGITLKDPGLVQLSNQEEVKSIQQEKQ